MADRHVEVFVQINGEDILAGNLYVHRRRGQESATFSYVDSYLILDDAYALDPQLPLNAGSFQTAAGRPLFGIFSDCAPDRWGRRLILKAERRRVRRDGGAVRSFGEADFLLGVRDDLRQGALRFRDPQSHEFLASETRGVPSLIELPRLLRASERFEKDSASDEELVTLLKGGSSLGGARPKAHVIASDGRLAIAKFPATTTDDWDVVVWEGVALTLARRAGIRVPVSEVLMIKGRNVLVVDRFDRKNSRRHGYASAMTMLEASDGDQRSYLEIADVIEQISSHSRRDLHELWRRVVFSVLISNTDDHLRNHGFVRGANGGWELSPAFDLNPNPQPGPKYFSTTLDFDDAETTLEKTLEAATYFRLDTSEAREIVDEVRTAASGWRNVARQLGIAESEVGLMEEAFA